MTVTDNQKLWNIALFDEMRDQRDRYRAALEEIAAFADNELCAYSCSELLRIANTALAPVAEPTPDIEF